MEPGDLIARQRLSKHVPRNTTIEAVSLSIRALLVTMQRAINTSSPKAGVTKIGHPLRCTECVLYAWSVPKDYKRQGRLLEAVDFRSSKGTIVWPEVSIGRRVRSRPVKT
jgi:hypothetical protein